MLDFEGGDSWQFPGAELFKLPFLSFNWINILGKHLRERECSVWQIPLEPAAAENEWHWFQPMAYVLTFQVLDVICRTKPSRDLRILKLKKPPLSIGCANKWSDSESKCHMEFCTPAVEDLWLWWDSSTLLNQGWRASRISHIMGSPDDDDDEWTISTVMHSTFFSEFLSNWS